MKATNDILGLLHDTNLIKVIRNENNEIRFCFSFYSEGDKEQKVNVISSNVLNISCIEHYRNEQSNEIDVCNLGDDVYFLRAKLEGETIEMFLEDIMKDTFIILKYSGTSHQITGDINQLKEFWDLPVTV